MTLYLNSRGLHRLALRSCLALTQQHMQQQVVVSLLSLWTVFKSAHAMAHSCDTISSTTCLGLPSWHNHLGLPMQIQASLLLGSSCPRSVQQVVTQVQSTALTQILLGSQGTLLQPLHSQ